MRSLANSFGILLDIDAKRQQSLLAPNQFDHVLQQVLNRCSNSSQQLLAKLFPPLLDPPKPDEHPQDFVHSLEQGQFAYLQLQLNDANQLSDFQIGLNRSLESAEPYFLDFNKGQLGYRLLKQLSPRQDLFRAIGVKQGLRPRVLDCNAGLGRDSLLFAAIGCAVTSVERHPLLFLAVDDALRRCLGSHSTIAQHCAEIRLLFDDAETLLRDCDVESFDTVYLDPMFPERRKSAQVKHEAQLLQYYCGDDDDSEKLLVIARQRKFKRICVKRPLHSPFLNNEKPSLQYKGKSTRFDVYFSTP